MRCRTPTDLLCAEERAAAMAHTAKLRNRIEAYLTGLAGAAGYGRGFPGPGRRHVWVPGGDRHRIPGSGRVGMVNTANALHDLPVVKDAWAAGSISGLHVYQILAHAPAIDDFTSKQAAIVGLAKLTDASEVRRVLQVAAEADNPTHLDLSLDQQRAKRSLRLSAGRMGCGRSPDARRGRRGDPGRNPGIVHPPRTPTTPPPRPSAAPMP